MEKLVVSPNAYYQDKWGNNGYIIAALPFAFVVFGKDGEAIKSVDTLEDAEKFTNSL